MIRIFLKDLPYSIAQPMFREFDYKKRELKKWEEASQSKRIIPYLRIDIEQLNFKKFEYTLFAPS
jgi:hypothetical protein